MGYTDKEKELIEAYKNATDTDVKDFVEDVLAGREKLNYVTVAFLPESAISKIKELTGKDVAGYRVVLDINAVRHINNRHGKSGEQDHSMSDSDDVARMGYVIMHYDDISFDGTVSTGYVDGEGKPSPLIRISKKIDGTYYVVEAVSMTKSKRNYVVSAFIGKA